MYLLPQYFFIFGFSFTTKANTRDVAFHLDNSFAGSTFFSQNAIQQWREFLTRRLRINREIMVQVLGVFYYRTMFGKINMGRFTRNIYVPHDMVAVTVKQLL